MAVDAFFVVSGFLIASSYDRAPALLPYLIRRGFRIYPLYAVVVALQLVGMIAVSPIDPGVSILEALRYLGFNLIFANFMAHDVGGLLAYNSDPGINPSLWTLKVEVGFYLVFPGLWWLVRRYGVKALMGIFICSSLFAAYFDYKGDQEMMKQLPGALRFFVVGMALYYCRNWMKPRRGLAWLALVPIYILSLSETLRIDTPLFYPLVVGLLVYVVGFSLPTIKLPRDFSYGVYLVHGPLIQLGIVTGLYDGSLLRSLCLYLIVFMTAVIAEILVEVPAINMGHKLSKRVRERLA